MDDRGVSGGGAYALVASPHEESKSRVDGEVDADQLRQQQHPLERAGWLSQLTMWWMNDLIFRYGPRQPLQESDVWALPFKDRTDHLQRVFDGHYATTQAIKADSTRPPPIHGAMWRSTKDTMTLAIALYFISAAAALVQPLLIKEILEFLEDPTASQSQGYVLAAFLTVTAFVSVSALDFGMFRATRAGIQARTIVVNAVFQKTLLLSSTARQSMNSGDIITLAGVDSERLYEAYASGLWAIVSPVMVAVVSVLIGVTMGLLVGLAAALSAIAILTFAMTNSRKIGQLRRRILETAGERVKLTNEALQGIRVIKMYAWEDAILDRVNAIRQEEIVLLRKYSYMRAANYVALTMGQTFMTAACLVVYVYQGNTLTVPTAFALLAFTNVCRMPFSVFSNAAVFANEALASMDRLATFLAADEVEISDTQPNNRQDGGPAVEIHAADFTWGSDIERPPTLRSINWTVAPGTLTIIVGAVGSGKSSLMSALLGEMHQLRGSCTVRGAIAYASQQPWIQHNTVRENILFGGDFDREQYGRVVRACQLTQDMKTLAHGDLTEIGERGMNLSGGQKARVSLARVMYRLGKAEVLVLDDPLSALDVHVANAVFHECVVKLASDKTRLLVLNAHYHLLRHADRVVVMANGEIVGDGSYEEMKDKFSHLEDEDQADEKATPRGTHEAPYEMMKSTVDEFEEPNDEKVKQPGESMMLVEDRAMGAITWRTYAAFLASSGCGHGVVLGLALFGLFALGQCAIVASDYFLTYWSNGSLFDDDDGSSNREVTLLWFFVAIAIVATLLAIVRAVVFTEICVQSSKQMHSRYFKKVLLAPIATFFDVTPVGIVLNRFSRDLDQIDNPLPYYGLALLVYLMLTLAILIVCAITAPTTLILYAPLWYACYKLQQAFLAISRDLKRLDGTTRSPFLNLVAETINGLESIRAFEMTKQFSYKCKALIDRNAKVFFLFQQSSNWFVMRLDWLVTTVVIAVAFAVVAWRESIGAAAAGIALTYAVQLTMNFQRLMTRASSTDNFLTSFERLAHYNSLPEDGVVDTSALSTASSNWPSQGTLEFQNVSLRYRPGLDLVLREVSFSIQNGEKIGVCGRTGSGKSTLMNAIFRTVELASGRVVIDGVDIAALPVRTLRSRLTVIPQDPVLFSGSLRENLDPFNEKSDAELFDALRSVQLMEDVAKWSQGLAYVVYEKGENLSVGQRQLLCIARALLRHSKIVLIDEATASVDQALDRIIQVAIQENFRACTTLTIAHRLETIAQSDRVLVMDQGCVVEFDTPANLMAKKNGQFASLMTSTQGR